MVSRLSRRRSVRCLSACALSGLVPKTGQSAARVLLHEKSLITVRPVCVYASSQPGPDDGPGSERRKQQGFGSAL